MKQVMISGSGLFVPPYTVTNEELVQSFNAYVETFNQENQAKIDAGAMAALLPSSVAFIEKASGVQQRYLMDKVGVLDPARMKPFLAERENECLSVQAEMAVSAAKMALKNAGLQGSDIDLVVVACSNMQRAYPAVAIEVQAALGANGFAFDMNVACSSATFGIQTAANAVKTGQAKRALVISPEICSAHLNFCERDSHFIFGDAATAVVIEVVNDRADANGFEILGAELKTLYSNNIRNNFGFLNRCDESGIGLPDKLFVQQGRKVFKEVCPMVGETIVNHLAALSITPSDLKRMWLHQANLAMNQLIARRVLGRDATLEEAPVILDRFANTSSAGSVIAFHLYHADLVRGDIGVLCSFGAGYSVGCIVLQKTA